MTIDSKNFSKTNPVPKPILRKTIGGIQPQPPTQNRLPPNLPRDKISRKPRPKREKLSLRESIDYDQLSPSEQAKWDAGIYGSIQLKQDRGREYYVVRWVDPLTGSLRSNSLGKDYQQAKAKLKQMILG
jgi:hypothetical protein